MVLSRKQIKPPTLKQKVEPFPPLGGDVIVRGLLLSQRLESDSLNRHAREVREDETEEEARARAGAQVAPRVLQRCVVDEAGEPLLSALEWDVLGSSSPEDVLRLFNVAMGLSGQDSEEIEKN